MAKYCLKKPSKRMVCAKRFKIEKKVREHNRKLKRDEKKNKANTWKAKHKPISVPNKCPFKEEILVEAEKERERLENQKLARKVEAKRKKSELKSVGTKRKIEISKIGLAQLSAKAAKQAEDFNDRKANQKEISKALSSAPEKSVKAFAGEVQKTIESADIIIEVLDARDPLGSRCLNIENKVLKSGKRLVLLLNKIDLVPKHIVQKWLNYFRLRLPTLAFKASTQEQKQNIGRMNMSVLNASGSKCIGAELLMKLLGNYCRNKDVKTSITVGLIGYPNVGKSSVINSLKRKRACNVGAIPGITRQIQEIELDKHIRLLDSPGVVLATKGQLDPIEIALKNAVRVENLNDPIAPVQAILRRCSRDNLMLHYNLPEFKDCDEFLALLARKIGRLKKGARPDVNAAAKKVLNDWNSGKLRYYTVPPEDIDLSNTDTLLCTAELLEEFSKEFDLDALSDEQEVVVEGLPVTCESIADVEYTPDVGTETSNDLMEIDEGKVETVIFNLEKKKEKDVVKEASMLTSLEIDGNVQLNRAIKLAVKKQKKRDRKHHTRTEAVIDTMMSTTIADNQEDYDFSAMND